MKKKKIIILIAVMMLVLALFTGCSEKNSGNDGVLLECDFNSGDSGFTTEAYVSDGSDFSYSENEGVDGTGCLKIVSNVENDARFIKEIDLQKDKIYLISADVKTENLSGVSDPYALVCFMHVYESFQTTNTNEWTHLETYVSSDSSETYTLALRLGFYGNDTSGTAYFDNLKVENVEKAPKNASVVNVTQKSTKSEEVDADYDEDLYDDMKVYSWLITAVAVVVFIIWKRYSEVNENLSGEKSPKVFLIALFSVAFVTRIVLAALYYQCDIDVNLFQYWGDTGTKGFADIYNNATNIDYPPLYLYFLTFNSAINSCFSFLGEGQDTLYRILVKLPSILADLGIGYFIYKIARKQGCSSGNIVYLVAIWLMNPLVILDSACWGQVDSMLGLLVVLTLYFLIEDKFLWAGVFMGLGIMLKPQMIILSPIVFYVWLFKTIDFVTVEKKVSKAFKNFGLAIGGLLGGIILPCVPFLGMGMQEVTLLGKTFKAPWIVYLIVGTANHYEYATVNCYNFWFVLGKNWVKDENLVSGISIYTWGMLAIVAVSLLAFFLYMRSKKSPEMVYMLSAFMYMGVSTFGPRMHERYFFPAVCLLVIAAIYMEKSNGKRNALLSIFGIMSIYGFLEVHEIMMGLLVGGSMKDAGADYSAYADYYWPSLTSYRGVIAFLTVIFTVAIVAFMIYYIKEENKNDKKHLVKGKKVKK